MSLTLKYRKRPNLSKSKVFVEDTSLSSPNYFKLSDVPQILPKGKTLLRISGNSQNLVEGSQISIDVRDVNGNEIYYEVPDFIEDNKSRVISIWIYHDKGDGNTPNGNAHITIVGTAKFDLNGNPIPKKFQNVPNVRWSTSVTVDRDRPNKSEIIFDPTSLPTITVSESIETYTNIPQGSGLPTKTTVTGTDAKYMFKGSTPVGQTSTSTPFNQEMVDGTLFLHSFTNPATPTTSISNPTNITSYTSSIVEVIDTQTVKLETPYSTTFDNRVGLVHTFNNITDASYKIEYFSTGSYTTSNSKRAFANITISGSDPMVGVVDKVKVLIKSDGLDSDDELLNEVSVPFSSSYLLKIPIPSEHLGDVQKLKIQYLNSIGNISRTETISDGIAFQGTKEIVEGTLGGFAITATTISSSYEISSSIPALSIHADGTISGSNLLIRQNYGGTMYSLIDTTAGTIDATNVGRQIVSDTGEYSVEAATGVVVYYPVKFLKGETHLGISFHAKGTANGAFNAAHTVKFSVANAITGSGQSFDYYDTWDSAEDIITYTLTPTGTLYSALTSSIARTAGGDGSTQEIPSDSLNKYCKLIVTLTSTTAATELKIKNINVVVGKQFAADIAQSTISGDPGGPSL